MNTLLTKSNSFFNFDSVINQYFSDIRRYPLLSKAEEDQAALAHDTDKLVMGNLRFAVRLAHAVDYYGELEDLIQCANYGLMKAAEAYDPSKMGPTGRFIHFAKSYILGEMMRYSRKQQSCFSRDDYYLSLRIKNVREEYMAEYGEEADSDYIAAKLGVPVTKVEDILRVNCEHVSTDETYDEETGATYGDTLRGNLDADADLMKSDDRSSLKAELHSALTAKEETVVCDFFGIGRKEPMSIDDIAVKLDLTPQRCRQLNKSALEKLRQNGVLKEMVCAH